MKIALVGQDADSDSRPHVHVGRATCSVVWIGETLNRLRLFVTCAKQAADTTVIEKIKRGLGGALAEMEERE